MFEPDARAAAAADPDDPLTPFLGPDGRLASALPGYEPRAGQERMMRAVQQAITARQVLLVEAGTGTGKSLAYLLPAALSGEPVVVSTGTKTLQDQLFHKDIPFVQRQLGVPFTAALLKGRTNYLCLERLDQARATPELFLQHGVWIERLRRWVAQTQTGDRAELADLADDAAVWREVSTGAEGCLGQNCSHFDECFVMLARRRAAAADLVVVNHHLFFADLSLRDSAGFSLLPPAQVVIFDEAHNLEDVAAAHFGEVLSNYKVRDLTGDAVRTARTCQLEVERIQALSDAVGYACEAFFECYRPLLPRARLRPGALPPGLTERWFELDNALAALGGLLALQREAEPALARLAERCEAMRATLDRLATASDPGQVVWVEAGARATFLRAAPVDVGAVLQQTLFTQVEGLVFTSATLTTDGSFGHVKRRFAIDYDCEELIIESPFDYPEQALLFVPPGLPAPSHPHFCDAAAALIEELTEITGGRAFVLFTSFANLRRVWELLRGRLAFPTFKQGDGSREALLARFRSTPNAVLLATGSFWEGVDVAGEALSLVIIDKLPFAPPDDPLTSARIEHLQARGDNAFMGYQVPTAIISLKQGFGRLIRHRGDRGIVAVLDNRLVHSRYGRHFLDSLPPARRVRDLDDLRQQWARISTGQGPGRLPDDDPADGDLGSPVQAVAAWAEAALDAPAPLECQVKGGVFVAADEDLEGQLGEAGDHDARRGLEGDRNGGAQAD